MRRCPAVGGDTAATIFIVEDLPAPLGPRNPNASPARTSTSMPSTATSSPNRLVSPRASSSAACDGRASNGAGPVAEDTLRG